MRVEPTRKCKILGKGETSVRNALVKAKVRKGEKNEQNWKRSDRDKSFGAISLIKRLQKSKTSLSHCLQLRV